MHFYLIDFICELTTQLIDHFSTDTLIKNLQTHIASLAEDILFL